jgi:hypothetical protein
MAKFINDVILDAAVDKVIADADKVILFDSYSTDFATINTNKLGEYAPTMSKANGDTSGRKAILAAQAAVPITAAGNFNNFAVVDTVNSRVLYVGNGTTKPLTIGDKVDTPENDLEFADPS